jgi:hypothetical protein
MILRTIAATLALAAVAGALTGCDGNGAAASDHPEPLVLRTYKVPQGLESDVRSMLYTVLGGSESPAGRVTTGPGGTLVVVAPEALHQGIEGLIGEIGGLDSPAKPVPVKLTYWLVIGRPGGDGSGLAGTEIAPVLAEIVNSQGPMRFELLERLELTSTGEERAGMTGATARIQQRASVIQDRVVADVEIATSGVGVIETRVQLQPRQFLVLGQAGYRDSTSRDPLQVDGTLFYVIRPDVES